MTNFTETSFVNYFKSQRIVYLRAILCVFTSVSDLKEPCDYKYHLSSQHSDNDILEKFLKEFSHKSFILNDYDLIPTRITYRIDDLICCDEFVTNKKFKINEKRELLSEIKKNVNLLLIIEGKVSHCKSGKHEVIEFTPQSIKEFVAIETIDYIKSLITCYENEESSKKLTEILSFIDEVESFSDDHVKTIFYKEFDEHSFSVSNNKLCITRNTNKVSCSLKKFLVKEKAESERLSKEMKPFLELENNVKTQEKKFKGLVETYNNSVKFLYRSMNNVAKQLSADGGPTNAELTQASMESIISMCVRHGLNCDEVWGDAGCAVNLSSCHVSLKLNCRSIGYELVKHRSLFSCINIMKAMDDKLITDQKIAHVHCDMFEISSFKPVTWLYMFDEAFEPALITHLVKTCKDSNVKYIMSFKQSKTPYIAEIFEENGYIQEDKERVTKSCSGEQNTVYLYRNDNCSEASQTITDNNDANNRNMSRFNSFIEDMHHQNQAVRYNKYHQLHDELDILLSCRDRPNKKSRNKTN